MSTLPEQVCQVCGIPADAGFFDDSRIAEVPDPGEELVLASFALHPNYCGALLYFAQFTDVHAAFPAAVLTPGLEWGIRCNGVPRDPYGGFDRIINPWGLLGFPIHLRLEEGCLTELVVRRVTPPEETSFLATGSSAPTRVLARRGRGLGPDLLPELVGGRLLGRYWYNPMYGGLA